MFHRLYKEVPTVKKINRLLLICLFIIYIPASNALEVVNIFNHDLSALPDNQEVAMITVEYGPGEFTPPHRHNAHTYIYVLEGEFTVQVEGGEEKTVSAGEVFYELPIDTHLTNKNRSGEKGAKILAMFIKTKDAPFIEMLEK